MKVSKGDELVFAGRKDGGKLDSHFRNFRIGKTYVVSDIARVGYDLDDIYRFDSTCVLFKDETYGCHLESIDTYFVHKGEWRDSILYKILPRRIIEILKK
jgi:hypothetical protein